MFGSGVGVIGLHPDFIGVVQGLYRVQEYDLHFFRSRFPFDSQQRKVAQLQHVCGEITWFTISCA